VTSVNEFAQLKGLNARNAKACHNTKLREYAEPVGNKFVGMKTMVYLHRHQKLINYSQVTVGKKK